MKQQRADADFREFRTDDFLHATHPRCNGIIVIESQHRPREKETTGE
jgi:hypothetical protein